MTQIHAVPERIAQHGVDVLTISEQVLDGAAAGAKEMLHIGYVFGVMNSPDLVPPMELLAASAEALILALAGGGAAIGVGLIGTSEVYSLVEESNLDLVKKAMP